VGQAYSAASFQLSDHQHLQLSRGTSSPSFSMNALPLWLPSTGAAAGSAAVSAVGGLTELQASLGDPEPAPPALVRGQSMPSHGVTGSGYLLPASPTGPTHTPTGSRVQHSRSGVVGPSPGATVSPALQSARFAAAAAAGAAAAAEAVAAATAGRMRAEPGQRAVPLRQYGLQVLIVEDERVNAKLVGRMLTRLGCRAKEVHDGADLSAVSGAELAARFGVILLDIIMVRSNGKEVCARLRREGYDGMLVAMTANASKKDVADYSATGFDAVLAKPFTVGDVESILNMATEALGAAAALAALASAEATGPAAAGGPGGAETHAVHVNARSAELPGTPSAAAGVSL
jgi:CheY-like chemotaxis protein